MVRCLSKAANRVEVAGSTLNPTIAISLVLGMLRQWDVFHSEFSAEKGRAGMLTNIEKGFRAGGKAPIGYKLEHHETGALRAGVPVRVEGSSFVGDRQPLRRQLTAHSYAICSRTMGGPA